MRKGRFGIVLCFYPIAAFVAVILHSPLIAAALAAAAIFLEKDEWAGRQTLQAWILSALVFFADFVSSISKTYVSNAFFYGLLSFTSTILLIIIVLVTLVFSILGIIRVRKDGEANIPLCADLAYRAYGKVKPKPMPVQYSQPYQPGMPMQQPMPPQGQYSPAYMQGQPVPQQYTPPMAGAESAPQPQPSQPGQADGSQGQ